MENIEIKNLCLVKVDFSVLRSQLSYSSLEDNFHLIYTNFNIT